MPYDINWNPRSPRRSTAIEHTEELVAAAENQHQALLRRQPYLWDPQDVEDKLVGLWQVYAEVTEAQEADKALEARLVAKGTPRSWSERPYFNPGLYREQYDALFRRWFFAMPQKALAWHKIAMASPDPVGKALHAPLVEVGSYRRRSLLEDWVDTMRPPLIRLDTHSTNSPHVGLPGNMSYVGYYGEQAAEAVTNEGIAAATPIAMGLESCIEHGWGLVHYPSGRGGASLTLLVKLPDTRIAVFHSRWAGRVSVGHTFGRSRSPDAFNQLHFHKPVYYTNIHWEPRPPLKEIQWAVMLALDHAGIILTQREMETHAYGFEPRRFEEEVKQALGEPR